MTSALTLTASTRSPSARAATWLADAAWWREQAAQGGYHAVVGDWQRHETRSGCIEMARRCLYMARAR